MSTPETPRPNESFSTPPDELKAAPKDPTEWDYANQLEKRLPPIRTVGDRWFVYENGVWAESSYNIYRPVAQNVYPPGKRTEKRAACLLKHLESRWQCSDSIFHGAVAFSERGSVLVNVLNGIVEVYPDRIDLLRHDAGLYFTRALNVAYNPLATCPLFDRTLAEALPDPLDQVLFELCLGNFLLPDCRFEVALVGYGEAGSGKSTLAQPIIDIFGVVSNGLLTRLSMGQICDPNCYSLAKLRYACVNLGTELQSIAVDESANFKTLVSGEALEARPIYCAPFTMHSHCKLWFLANNLPRFKNGTEAELRRTRFLRFDYKPVKPDVLLKKKLSGETAGVFNRMLRGLQQVLTLDRMPLGGTHSQRVHERFKVSNDPLGTFIARYCIVDPAAHVAKEELQNAFVAYCDQFSLSTNLSTQFYRMLYERYPDIEEVRKRDATSATGRRQTVTGLTLTPHAASLVVKEEEQKRSEVVKNDVPTLKVVDFDLSKTSIS